MVKPKFLIIFALMFLALVQDVLAQNSYDYYECSWNGSVVVRTQHTVSENISNICTPMYANGGTLNGDNYTFIAEGTTTISNGLTVTGNCKLILCDGAVVTINDNGIKIASGATLHIYSQSDGESAGKLIINDVNDNYAAINGSGSIEIHGGYVEARGGGSAAGIGGNVSNNGIPFTIFGGTVHAYGGSFGAGIGGGECRSSSSNTLGSGGTFTAYGGIVYAVGGENAAGIGGGNSYGGNIDSNPAGGTVTIFGGVVEAHGGAEGAGIGGGKFGDGGIVTIHDGTVIATSKKRGAGIGSGAVGSGARNSGTVIIHGGNINASGGDYGAGIGGGQHGNGAIVNISGGDISASGGMDAAGIGSGEKRIFSSDNINGGTLTVTGGTVLAHGMGWGAGIGGGEDASGSTVSITGGIVEAYAGSDAAGKNGSAIGSEDGDGYRGSLTIGANMMVHAGSSFGSSTLFPYDTRVPACYYRPYCRIEACDHHGATYTINGTGDNDTHTLRCPHCLDRTETKHTFGLDGICTICGAVGSTYVVNIYLPNDISIDGNYFLAQKFYISADKTFELPEPPAEKTPANMVFAGWMQSDAAGLTSYITTGSEQLMQAGSSFTVSATANLTARYRGINVTLQDDADNRETLFLSNGKKAQSVNHVGRTLYKDGSWNTLCLPFDLTIGGSQLDGDGVDVRVLSSSIFADGTLTLNFAAAPATIAAGTPFIIKWDNKGTVLTDLVFSNVVINNNLVDATSDYVDFIGTYSPVNIYQLDDKTKLYLGADNMLYYPMDADFAVNACRGYFQLKNNLTAGEPVSPQQTVNVRKFVLNFGESSATGIHSFTPNLSASEGVWFTLDGRKLKGRPTQCGIYIYNGAKMVIK